MSELRELLPLLAPILVVQFVLIVVALRDLLRRDRVRGQKWMWALVIVFINLLGPILYLVLAREDE
ncbi:MAG TPA: PLDc N-terminal domain-containing protein [Candidatus Sulfomarinibacteraceae bacterium]|nr:PLDc N-terminal domain-containing protein [Candidatus Sulfomarinibacteraceae bacterium]